MTRPLLLVCLVLLAPRAWAARPFIVDDARIVERGACQVEAWRRNNPTGHEWWALPACNPFGAELTLGGGLLYTEAGIREETNAQVQIKGLFRELETNAWGFGWSVGAIRRANINLAQNQLGNYYVNGLASRSLFDDRIVLLTNLGLLDSRTEDRRGVSWGVGAEVYATPRFMLAAETYGTTGFGYFYQAGLRLWLVPDHVQVDATVGADLRDPGNANWTTIGIRLITPSFF
jgi:hypothetical protein